MTELFSVHSNNTAIPSKGERQNCVNIIISLKIVLLLDTLGVFYFVEMTNVNCVLDNSLYSFNLQYSYCTYGILHINFKYNQSVRLHLLIR